MNIYGAEVFRYSKSFYGRMIMILVVPFACLTAAFLYYISNGISSDFLAAAGFSEQTVAAIKGQMSGIDYIASSFSASELLIVLMIYLKIMNRIHCAVNYREARAEQPVILQECWQQLLMPGAFYWNIF